MLIILLVFLLGSLALPSIPARGATGGTPPPIYPRRSPVTPPRSRCPRSRRATLGPVAPATPPRRSPPRRSPPGLSPPQIDYHPTPSRIPYRNPTNGWIVTEAPTEAQPGSLTVSARWSSGNPWEIPGTVPVFPARAAAQKNDNLILLTQTQTAATTPGRRDRRPGRP